MTERDALLESIASTIRPYREGEVAQSSAAHVDRWASQFSYANQLPFLREFDSMLKKTFLTREKVIRLLSLAIANPLVVGVKDAKQFWRKAKFLNIQQNGQSQREMIDLIRPLLKEHFDVDLDAGGEADGVYVYLDDITYTGSRVASDLASWFDDAPDKAMVKVVSLVSYTSTNYARRVRTPRAIAESGKDISVSYGQQIQIENRLTHNKVSGVLWPIVLPDDPHADEYMREQNAKFEPRLPGGNNKLFATEEGRQVLELEFLIAGRKIRSQIRNPADVLKPLGFYNFGVGFGSTLCTYRNCPNTAPLALWWGEEGGEGALEWYPLLPRKTY